MPDILANTGATFGDLLLAVALAVNYTVRVDADTGAAIAPALPTDLDRLALLKAAVNNGYMAFMNGVHPDKGEPWPRWSFMDRAVQVPLSADGTDPANVAGDPGRIRLPGCIRSNPLEAFVTDTDGVLLHPKVEITTPQRIANYNAFNQSTGTPCAVSCRPLLSPDGPKGGLAWELLVAPKPDEDGYLVATFKLQPDKMVALDERHLAGAGNDYAIEKYALLEFCRNDKTRQAELPQRALDAAAAFDAARLADAALQPRSLGPGALTKGSNRGVTTLAEARRLTHFTTTYPVS